MVWDQGVQEHAYIVVRAVIYEDQLKFGVVLIEDIGEE